jgi:hypothetical protein
VALRRRAVDERDIASSFREQGLVILTQKAECWEGQNFLIFF